jgi:hypothetical protein
MLFFEIVAGRPLPPPGAAQVSEIIEEALRPRAGAQLSFIAIFETLKANDFGIVAGVDSAEVSAFVSRVESMMQSGESE